MLKRFTLIASIFLIGQSLQAQYYYKDIVSSKQAMADMQRLKQNNVRSVKIRSFEDDNSPSDGFFGERRTAKDFRKSEVMTRSNVSGMSLMTTFFDEAGKLLTTTDSSDIATTRTTYSYDADGRIIKIKTSLRSADDDFVNEILEEHYYEYGDEFNPFKMLRVKNKFDTLTVLFMHDENGNIGIEKDTKSGGKYYYYYDEKSRLTDIAHANEFKAKLLPDYMFEYDSNGQVTQMTTVDEGGSDYYIWRYTYVNGLRTSEKCFSKRAGVIGIYSIRIQVKQLKQAAAIVKAIYNDRLYYSYISLNY